MSTEVLSAPVEQPVTAGSVESLQQGVEGMELQQAQVETAPLPAVEAELHRACAEGSLDGVRQVLSNGLEALETLGECAVSLWTTVWLLVYTDSPLSHSP